MLVRLGTISEPLELVQCQSSSGDGLFVRQLRNHSLGHVVPGSVSPVGDGEVFSLP